MNNFVYNILYLYLRCQPFATMENVFRRHSSTACRQAFSPMAETDPIAATIHMVFGQGNYSCCRTIPKVFVFRKDWGWWAMFFEWSCCEALFCQCKGLYSPDSCNCWFWIDPALSANGPEHRFRLYGCIH